MINVRRRIFEALDTRASALSPRQIRQLRWTPIWTPQLEQFRNLIGEKNRRFKKEALWAAYETAYAEGKNAAPMETMGRLLEKLVFGELVSARASRQMLGLLADVRTGAHRIRAGLPRNMLLAHKTGSQWRRTCDVGAAYAGRHKPIVFAICTAGIDVAKAEPMIAKITWRAYASIQRQREAERRMDRLDHSK